MSAIGAAIARAVGSLGGPVTAGAIVGGGLLAGALGGGFLASGGGGQQAAATGQLPVYPCPETGPVIAMVTAGQQMLATGRNEAGTWLRIHYPAPGRTEAWVEAGPLEVEGTISTLPVAECTPELAIAPPSFNLPEESYTPAENNPPSAAPTPVATATPTPTPTATPNARPNVASLTASTRQVSFDTGNYCPDAVKQVTFRVKATDAVGVTGVTLFWRKPGAAAFTQTPMTRVSGTAKDGFWQVTLDTAANGINQAGNLNYYAAASDDGGATRRIPATTTNAIQVKVCENTGPTISGATSSTGASLFWDPLNVGKCQTATNVTASVKDVDGVGSVQLFYRRPGDASFLSKPMDNTTIKGKWFANLDTQGDKITIVSPPTDTLSWYVRAVDKKGVATKGLTRTITIRRCDSETTFYVSSLSQQAYTVCGNLDTLRFSFSITDPDEAQSAPMTGTLRYTIKNTYTGPGGGGTTTGTVTAPIINFRFSMTSKAFDLNKHYQSNIVTWTLTTTDKYGGTTTSAQGKDSFAVLACIG